MSSDVEKAMYALRKFLFANVFNPIAKGEERKVVHMIEYMNILFIILTNYRKNFGIDQARETTQRTVCDFIACMSDRYSVNLYKEIMIPKS